jgi:hypothetical protein
MVYEEVSTKRSAPSAKNMTASQEGEATVDQAFAGPFARSSTGISRRAAIKSLGFAAAALMFPSGSARPLLPATEGNPTSRTAENPRWYGFNLLEYFSTDPDWMKYFPYKNDGMFLEDDFRWIRDWGFNWVRLPMDYRFWTDSQDLLKIREDKVAPIDRAIRLGEKYGVHVNLCLHRTPGYSILDTLDEAVTGIHVTKEKSSLFADPTMLDAFVHQWTYFADRYKGISSEKLSFNLVNEPIVIPTAPEMEELKKAKLESQNSLRGELAKRHAADYTRVARAAIEGISKHDRNASSSQTDTTEAQRSSPICSKPEFCRVAIPTIPYSSLTTNASGRAAYLPAPNQCPPGHSRTVRVLSPLIGPRWLGHFDRGVIWPSWVFPFILGKWAVISTPRRKSFWLGLTTL